MPIRENALDPYYTHPDIARLCVDRMSTLNLSKDDVFLEPTAGAGAFVDALVNWGAKEIVRCDIDPKREDIQRIDFIGASPRILSRLIGGYATPIHVIGNPPFGPQSQKAVQCIRQCVSFASTISFVLPRSFSKISVQNRAFPPEWHLVDETVLPKRAFVYEGKDVDIPCVFQVWVKKHTPRPNTKRPVPVGYAFVKRADAHLAVRRVGFYAGRVTTDTMAVSPNTHYFVRLDPEWIPRCTELVERWNAVEFPEASCAVGPHSLSRDEIVARWNPVCSTSFQNQST